MNRDCADCGGFDFEWMHVCDKHRIEYCRGCECPYCAEDDDGDEDGFYYNGEQDEWLP